MIIINVALVLTPNFISGGGRKRQDSGFIASSNESIVPFPEIYQSSAEPRRSPSMPNLRVASSTNNEQQQQQRLAMKEAGKSEGDVFASHQQQQQRASPSSIATTTTTLKPAMVSIGISTIDLDHNMNHKVSDLHQLVPSTTTVPKKPETVVIQKRSFNCTGIDFGIGGVFVKDFDRKDISFKKGELSVGKNLLNISILQNCLKILIFHFLRNRCAAMRRFRYIAKLPRGIPMLLCYKGVTI